MNDTTVNQELESIQAKGLERTLVRAQNTPGRLIDIEGNSYLNFSSNNYLGLANHPDIQKAMIDGIKHWGCGSSSSRYIAGNYDIMAELENKLANYVGLEEALVFNRVGLYD